MNALVIWFQAHQIVAGGVAMWLLGNICASLPTPGMTSSRFYQFIFNLASAVGSQLPRSLPGLRLGGSQETTGVTVNPAPQTVTTMTPPAIPLEPTIKEK